MKNRKTTTYALALSAALVWALVAVQIVRWMVPDNETYHHEVSGPPQEAPSDPVAQKMDYADPFLKELGKQVTAGRRASMVSPAATSGEDNTPPPIIYKGLMNCSGVKVAIVMKDGASIMLRTGDNVSGFYVRDFTHDELVLERKGRKLRLEIR